MGGGPYLNFVNGRLLHTLYSASPQGATQQAVTGSRFQHDDRSKFLNDCTAGPHAVMVTCLPQLVTVQ